MRWTPCRRRHASTDCTLSGRIIALSVVLCVCGWIARPVDRCLKEEAAEVNVRPRPLEHIQTSSSQQSNLKQTHYHKLGNHEFTIIYVKSTVPTPANPTTNSHANTHNGTLHSSRRTHRFIRTQTASPNGAMQQQRLCFRASGVQSLGHFSSKQLKLRFVIEQNVVDWRRQLFFSRKPSRALAEEEWQDVLKRGLETFGARA